MPPIPKIPSRLVMAEAEALALLKELRAGRAVEPPSLSGATDEIAAAANGADVKLGNRTLSQHGLEPLDVIPEKELASIKEAKSRLDAPLTLMNFFRPETTLQRFAREMGDPLYTPREPMKIPTLTQEIVPGSTPGSAQRIIPNHGQQYNPVTQLLENKPPTIIDAVEGEHIYKIDPNNLMSLNPYADKSLGIYGGNPTFGNYAAMGTGKLIKWGGGAGLATLGGQMGYDSYKESKKNDLFRKERKES
jgi:hypothetical protein